MTKLFNFDGSAQFDEMAYKLATKYTAIDVDCGDVHDAQWIATCKERTEQELKDRYDIHIPLKTCISPDNPYLIRFSLYVENNKEAVMILKRDNFRGKQS